MLFRVVVFEDSEETCVCVCACVCVNLVIAMMVVVVIVVMIMMTTMMMMTMTMTMKLQASVQRRSLRNDRRKSLFVRAILSADLGRPNDEHTDAWHHEKRRESAALIKAF